MKENSKVPVSIYLVNKHLFEATAFKDIIKEIIERINHEKEAFIEEKISAVKFEGYSISLFYSYSKYPPKWKGFFEPLLSKSSYLKTAQNINHSFVCFVESTENIFAIIGGYDGQKVSHLMVPDFGLDILVKLFEKDNKVVKNIQDRGLTGNILGQTKFYRGDQRFSDENQFGKIFKQVQAKLDKEHLKKYFGFAESELNRKTSACMAKDSFQINKSINFETMLNIISKFDEILKRQANFSLNKVEHLTKRKAQNIELIEKLDAWAKNLLYTDCVKGKDPNVDFCHSKFDDFLNADLIQIFIDKDNSLDVPTHSTLGDIVRILKDSGNYVDTDERSFQESVLNRKIISYDSEGIKLTSDSIFEHVHGEFAHNGKTYFLLDKEWYRILPAFINELNQECLEMLKNAWDTSILTKSFNINQRESVYNQKYLNNPNYYVFDTIIPNNIELCDIMKFDESSIQLIHVKKGFDNSIRDLTSQINIAAKFLREELKTGLKVIKRVQKLTEESNLGELAKQKFPKNGLASLFSDKSSQQIIFCLAFVDKSSKNRNIKDHINKFNSNIAKFSLLELRNELFSMGFGFKIIQIKKE